MDLTLNMEESYEHLPLKVVGSLQWISLHVRFKYVLKTDDDSWICVDALLSTLAPLPRRALYWGKMNRHHASVEKVLHHGFVHHEFAEYFGHDARNYPTYAFGAAYVLSADVARAVSDDRGVDAAEHVKIEDVLVGQLVRQKLGTQISIVDARNSSFALGYTRRGGDPKRPSKAGPAHLRRLCAAQAHGGRESTVVHRIPPAEVRKCERMARERCACDAALARCRGGSG